MNTLHSFRFPRYHNSNDTKPLVSDLLRNLSILLNRDCIDENYITNKMRLNFPNFNYENSCFTLLDNYDNIYEEIFDYLYTNIKNTHIDLSDNRDRISYSLSNGWIFFLKKFLNYLKKMSYNFDIKYIFIEAIERSDIEIIQILLQYNPLLMDEDVAEYISELPDTFILNNIDLLKYLATFFPFQINIYINYDEIIDEIPNMLIDTNNIQTCCICYENKSDLITECNHQYCTSCIKKWWYTKQSIIHNCPYCNTIIEPYNCKKF